MADVQMLVGGSGTVSETFAPGGVPTDLDGGGVPTVTITKPDGSAGPASGTVTRIGVGTYQFGLDGQDEVTVLKALWQGNIGGKLQKLTSRVEVVGDLLFTLDDLRNYSMPGSAATPFDDVVKYPSAKLQKARAATLARFTQALGWSPVPRHAREVHSVDCSGTVILDKLRATRLLSVTVAGVAKTASDYFIAKGGVLQPVSGYYAGYWSAYGFGVVAVEYQHGASGVDDDGHDAALDYAASRLNPSAFTSGTSYTTPDGVSVTYEPSEVGRGGFQRFTGVRSVDRWLNLQLNSGEPAVA